MAQKETIIYNSLIKRFDEHTSSDRFVFKRLRYFLNFNKLVNISFILLMGLTSCGEPEIKLSRAEKRIIDTLVDYQLDSIKPILDSICAVQSDLMIERAADSIILERRQKEERLRVRN